MMNIINTYYTFFGCNYDIFLQFCLILGWRKSIISILSETSSNKIPAPLNVPGMFLQTKSINESSLSHACPRALKMYPVLRRSGNKSIPFFLIPPKFSTLFLMQDHSPLTFNSCMRRLSSLTTVDDSFGIYKPFCMRVWMLCSIVDQSDLPIYMKLCKCGYPPRSNCSS